MEDFIEFKPFLDHVTAESSNKTLEFTPDFPGVSIEYELNGWTDDDSVELLIYDNDELIHHKPPETYSEPTPFIFNYKFDSSSNFKIIANGVRISGSVLSAGVSYVRFRTDFDQIEKNAMSELKASVKNGDDTVLLSVVLLVVSSADEASQAVDILNSGGGYKELREIGLTDLEALRVTAVSKLQIDATAYESNKALQLIISNPSDLMSFNAHLASKSLALPKMICFGKNIIANAEIYQELIPWSKL